MNPYVPSFFAALGLITTTVWVVKFPEAPPRVPVDYVDVSLEAPYADGEEGGGLPDANQESPPPLGESDPPDPFPNENPPPPPLEARDVAIQDPQELLEDVAEEPLTDPVADLAADLPDALKPKPKPKPKPKAKTRVASQEKSHRPSTTVRRASPATTASTKSTRSGTGSTSGTGGRGTSSALGGGGRTSGVSYSYTPHPAYPSSAKRAGAQGTVSLSVVISSSGSPSSVSVIRSSGNSALDQAAASTVASRWKFRPAYKNGSPVSSCVTVPVRFSLR